MGSKSDYLENKILDHVLKNTAYTSPTTVYVALYTATPSDTGGGTQCTGTGYARVAATFGAASGGSSSNSAAVDFGTAGAANWGTLTSFGIFDASTNGNLLYWGALTANKTPASGDNVKFAIGDLVVTED